MPIKLHVDQDQVVSGELDSHGSAGVADQAEHLTRTPTVRWGKVKRLDDAALDKTTGNLSDQGPAQVEVSRGGMPKWEGNWPLFAVAMGFALCGPLVVAAATVRTRSRIPKMTNRVLRIEKWGLVIGFPLGLAGLLVTVAQSIIM